MWPFRRRREPKESARPAETGIWRLGPDRTELEIGGGADRSPMTDEEQDRILDELDAEVDRLIAAPGRDRAPVDILLCPACGVYGEHLLDRDGFPAECRSCGWEGGAV